MTWAQRLKRVLDIDVESCARCGSAVRVIASIEELVRAWAAHTEGAR